MIYLKNNEIMPNLIHTFFLRCGNRVYKFSLKAPWLGNFENEKVIIWYTFK